MNTQPSPLHGVHTFWFTELDPADWFAGGKALDETITKRFAVLHAKVAAGEFWKDRTHGQSYLAEILVLDQFSRQIYRGTNKAFAYDGQALTLAQEAIMKNVVAHLCDQEKLFLYMPFMHSESPVIHEEAIQLYEVLGNDEAYQQAKIHKDIIDRFGRYPHRNKQLGRESTPEEHEYLQETDEVFFTS